MNSCDKKTYFAENIEIENANWFIKNEAKFKIEITDQNQALDLYYTIRNSNKYPFYNLFITRQVFDEKNVLVEEKLLDFMLSDEKTGKPFGNGIGDLFEHKFLVKKNFKFKQKGKYKIVLKQSMRQNPLPEIFSVGLIVEKAGPK